MLAENKQYKQISFHFSAHPYTNESYSTGRNIKKETEKFANLLISLGNIQNILIEYLRLIEQLATVYMSICRRNYDVLCSICKLNQGKNSLQKYMQLYIRWV